MSDTPRTQAELLGLTSYAGSFYLSDGRTAFPVGMVDADFARTLEKENAALRRALENVLEEMRMADRLNSQAENEARAYLAAISGTEG